MPQIRRLATMAASLTSRSIVRRSEMSGGAIAGAAVGSVVGVLLIILCAFPFIKRAIRNARAQREETTAIAEMGMAHPVLSSFASPTSPRQASTRRFPDLPAAAQSQGAAPAKDIDVDGNSYESPSITGQFTAEPTSTTRPDLPPIDVHASRVASPEPASQTSSPRVTDQHGQFKSQHHRRRSSKGSISGVIDRATSAFRKQSTKSERGLPYGSTLESPVLDDNILGPILGSPPAEAPQHEIVTTGSAAEYYSGAPIAMEESQQLYDSPLPRQDSAASAGFIAHHLVNMAHNISEAPMAKLKRSGTASSGYPPPSPVSLAGSPPPGIEESIEKDDVLRRSASPPSGASSPFAGRVSSPHHPAPGTVNPMDVWAPMGASEQQQFVEAELDRIENSPPPASVKAASPPPPEVVQTAPSPPPDFPSPALQQEQLPMSPPPHVDHIPHVDTIPHPRVDLTPAKLDAPPMQVQPIVTPPEDPSEMNNYVYVEDTDMDFSQMPPQTPPPHHQSQWAHVNTPLSVPGLSDDANSASPGSTFISTPGPQIFTPQAPPSTPGQTSISASSPRTFTCDECHRSFDQIHKLNHHKRYHERPHECTFNGCGKRFGTKTHLDRHINDKHMKTRKYHCTQTGCPYSKQGGKSFPRKDNWRRHIQNKHGYNPEHDPIEIVDEGVMMDMRVG